MAKALTDLQQIPVASSPTGGRGFSLPAAGNQPLMLAALGARKVSFGTANVHFSTSPSSDNPAADIPHGLGVKPVVVVAIAVDSPVSFYTQSGTTTTTNFRLLGHTLDGSSITGNVTADWVAIG